MRKRGWVSRGNFVGIGVAVIRNVDNAFLPLPQKNGQRRPRVTIYAGPSVAVNARRRLNRFRGTRHKHSGHRGILIGLFRYRHRASQLYVKQESSLKLAQINFSGDVILYAQGLTLAIGSLTIVSSYSLASQTIWYSALLGAKILYFISVLGFSRSQGSIV